MTEPRTRPPAEASGPGSGAAAYGPLRDDAIARLREWQAPDPGQEHLRRAFLTHLAHHADAMARSGPPAHLTGSVLVLDTSGDHVLLTLHQKAGRWFQFGGHFEPGDLTMRHGAVREAREESGIAELVTLPEIIQLDRHSLGDGFGRCREHLDVRYAAVAADDAVHTVSPESLDVRWWPADALPAETRDELQPLVRAAHEVIRR
ncbi:NUDIX hydrolase [Intrasporangium sp.]|uniref:NUDIX hydrolase n=1 Tax=Intrasporangium sp. TaxID=1925024 RepID=UPI0029399109|nr:NUDIX domain-containing protein [Intrasporangium sp.]MDV3219997.1 NUDIX domain-containing protein [Intrasporangium sp.]